MKGKKVSGGVCHPHGFKAAGVACGLKAGGELDLCILAALERCAAAATFTTNAFRAAPVTVSMRHLAGGHLRAAVVNSGNANACTGERGESDALAMAAATASALGADPGEIAVASTGVIGQYLDIEKIEKGIETAAAALSDEGGSDAARAIMTTDTRPKEIAWECDGFSIGGMAKGSGMIKPDMATMLAFITTDAEVEPAELSRALKAAVDATFNLVTVDGCTSTNDMVLAMASGASGVKVDARDLEEPLHGVCSHLARAMIEDGEGATRFISVCLREALDASEAKKAAMAIAESPLVKTAFFGGDPNWGRVVQALGQAVKDLDPGKVSVSIGGIPVTEGGTPMVADVRKLEAAVSGGDIELDVQLGRGKAEVEVWTCDYSYDYVKINAEYHN